MPIDNISTSAFKSNKAAINAMIEQYNNITIFLPVKAYIKEIPISPCIAMSLFISGTKDTESLKNSLKQSLSRKCAYLEAQDQTEEDAFMLTQINDSCKYTSSTKIKEEIFYIFSYMCLIQRRIQNPVKNLTWS